MSTNESSAKRETLGRLSRQYGFALVPEFATGVTVTSLSDSMDRVKPGSLYISMKSLSQENLKQIEQRGAYAALLPLRMRESASDGEFPLLFADPTGEQLGGIASDIAGAPAQLLAVFAVAGKDIDEVQATVIRLAEVLHMLGNPVGIISAAGSKSLERQLSLEYPVNMLAVQHNLAVCVEDGAAAVIISLDEGTLQHDALQAVGVDVLGCLDDDEDRRALQQRQTMERYGYTINDRRSPTMRTKESDSLARQASLPQDYASQNRLSLALSMVMAAGVHKSSISNALRITHELL